MSRGVWRAVALMCWAGMLPGCGGCSSDPATSPGESGRRRVALVGFDVCEPVIEGLRRGSIAGIVVQNPVRIGELGVRTMVRHLEKQPIEPRVSTGETLITPENQDDPDVRPLLFPPKADEKPGSLAGAKTKKWRLMVILKGWSQEYWKAVLAGARKAERELGNVEIICQAPEKEDDRLQQVQLVQGAIAAGVDGIVLAPLDTRALTLPVEAAVAKGVPVVVIDSGLDSSKPVSVVSTDNYHGGVLAAQRLGRLLRGEGKVVLLRFAVGSGSTEQRERGFTDTLAGEFTGITLLSESEYAGTTTEEALEAGRALLARYGGQVDGVFCPNETSTVGMMKALEEARLVPAHAPR